jgi:molybdopterin converting factor small subunit
VSGQVINFLEYLNTPARIGTVIAFVFLIVQIIGELLELKGKVVPEFVKVRKYFSRKKNEKKQMNETLLQVQTLLNEVNQHYSSDNIAKRDEWMRWVNERAVVYDASVAELTALKDALAANNELTLDLYININRNRIIDFASKIANNCVIASREEFNRIFKTYDDYEAILEKHNKTNGEVDIAIAIIKDAYADKMKSHSFIEDTRGY